MTSSSISYIVPAFNCSDTLAESIESIVNNNLEHGDEIIIIDDASTDNTKEVAYLLKDKYPFIKVLSHRYNKGSAAAGRNTGIENSSHDLIFCLDADNLLIPGSITKLKSYLIEQGADAAAFGEIHYFIEAAEKVDKKWILLPEISFLENINRANMTPCSSGNYLFTRTSWVKAGRYNESVGGAYDSWAFGVSQLAAGCKMVCLPGTWYLHRHGYESTFIRDLKKMNESLTVTRILMPYLNLLCERDVDYILHPHFQRNWFKRISSKKLKGAGYRENPVKKFLRRALNRIISKLF